MVTIIRTTILVFLWCNYPQQHWGSPMIFFHIDPSRLPNDWAPGTMSPRAKGGLVAVTVVVKADPTLSWMDGYLAWIEGRFFFRLEPR